MDYQKAYYILFNAITSVLYSFDHLEQQMESLKQAQQTTEAMYMEEYLLLQQKREKE